MKFFNIHRFFQILVFSVFFSCQYQEYSAIYCPETTHVSQGEQKYLQTLYPYHQAADLAESQNNTHIALAIMQKALLLPKPKSKMAESIYLDIIGRMIQILLKEQRLDEALDLIQKAQGESRYFGFYWIALQTFEAEIYQASATKFRRKGYSQQSTYFQTLALQTLKRAQVQYRFMLKTYAESNPGSFL